jgi:mRNA-degrading endonuclease toxin of MazEF toxin-antitoxin module
MHLRSIDKQRLLGRYGRVSDVTMQRVEEALKVATGLARI